ncbi:MAG: cbb3-type cytochrome oxidase assembly protein CcoS [Parachlamydiaceae bacterium]|nr:cbb3-type cytochrome oxidase assembly protein CcoS [Parachlamydiaceae bacterium]
MFWSVIGSIIAALAGLLVYVYYLRQGQFEDVESVKYQLFQEENSDD